MTYSWRAFPFRVRLDLPLVAVLTCAFIACDVTAAPALESRLRVVPVLFIPSDNSEIDGGKVAAYKDLVRKYLVLAQSYYRTQLVTDTFEIAEGDPLVYTAKHPHSYYIAHFKVAPDTTELAVREMFDWLGEDRYSSRSVYLQIYARPSAHALPAPLRYPIDDNYFGHGSTFNGPPNTGGGVIQLELQYLTDDYPFLSTLIHELGHAFGLDHADCHGYDMDTNGSMMASNTRLWSNGFNLSVPPPVFNPEEYLMLAQNKLAFPNFNFIPALHKSKGQVLENRGQLCLFRNERDDWEVPGYARHGFRALLGRQAGQWSRGRVLLAARGERRLRLEYVDLSPDARHVHLQWRTVFGPTRRSSSAKSTLSAGPIR
jgi:hypothetical protein